MEWIVLGVKAGMSIVLLTGMWWIVREAKLLKEEGADLLFALGD